MATEFATELDQQLFACKAALQDQAQAMLTLLLEFEAQLKARLDAAEAQIATLHADGGLLPADRAPVVAAGEPSRR